MVGEREKGKGERDGGRKREGEGRERWWKKEEGPRELERERWRMRKEEYKECTKTKRKGFEKMVEKENLSEEINLYLCERERGMSEGGRKSEMRDCGKRGRV